MFGGMSGFGGQNFFVNFDTGTIVIAAGSSWGLRSINTNL